MNIPSPCVGRAYQNAGNRPLLEMFANVEPGRILDCGCGAGDNARILQAHGWSTTGITISVEEQKQAAAFCDRVYLADLNFGIPEEIEGEFDIVLLSHVLEHLIHPESLLQSLFRVLKPAGRIAVALPNVMVYSQRLQFLKGRFDYTSTGLMDETHVRFYTFSTGTSLLEKNGYDLLISRADGAFPFWKTRRYLPGSWVTALNTWATTWRPGLFGSQLLYLAKAGSNG
ncbi:MAG: class I SAM-dependent methyltransferase [Chloroflexota bacterium]